MDEKGLEAALTAAHSFLALGVRPLPGEDCKMIETAIRAYLSALSAAPAGGWAVPVDEWPKEVDERVLLYVVHDNAQYEKDEARRLAEWEGWFTGSWTDFNTGGWTWTGLVGRVTHVAPLPTPPVKP